MVEMPPGTLHQKLVGFLFHVLGLFVEFYRLGQVLTAPYEMKTSPDSNAREPDVLFVANEHSDRLVEQRLIGPADLVVEVVSQESFARDRGDKFYEYQEAGVREYWVIDPRPGKERADFWVLDERGRYRPVPLDADGVYRSTVIPGFWIDADWLLGAERPDPQLVFAEIAGFPAAMIEQLRRDCRPWPAGG